MTTSFWVSQSDSSLAGLLTGLLGVRASPGVVFSARFHFTLGVKLWLSFSLFPSSLSFSLSPLAWPPPPRSSVQEQVWRGSQCSHFSCRMAQWNVGGVTHCWGVNCWDVRQWLIFNPLHTRPQQMTTCTEAKQGMRRDQDN